MAVSILLAIILPASLIAGSFATADTAASEPSAADTAVPAALGGTGGGGSSDPSRSEAKFRHFLQQGNIAQHTDNT